MAIVLDITKSRHIARTVREAPSASLADKLAAALRRGAESRFAEQRERIERTGRAGAF